MKIPALRRAAVAAFFVTVALSCITAPAARAQESGSVRFHEAWIEGRQDVLPVDDAAAMFARLFALLPDRVTVWPTENYYYFSFSADGRDYGGNFRLHPEERERGLINFAYFDTGDPSWYRHLILGASDGVSVNRVGKLEYEVVFKGRGVTFALNPISQEDPGPPSVLGDEVFIGRSFDESGFVFLLVHSPAANQFLWVLDEVQPASMPLVAMAPDLDVHVASGFVFLRLPAEARRILIGVDAAQVARNTYFDGPFDQLPDNWLPETRFRELAETVSPGLRGLINDRGEFAGATSRLAVTPYRQYGTLNELWMAVAACASARDNGQRLACLSTEEPLR